MQYFANAVSSYLSNEEGFAVSRPMTAAYVAATLNSYVNDTSSINNLLLSYQINNNSSLPQNKTDETVAESSDTITGTTKVSTAADTDNSPSTGAESETLTFTSASKAAAAAAILATDEVCIGYDPHNVIEDWEKAKLSTVVETFQKVPRSVQTFLGKKHVGIVMEDPGATSMKAFMNGASEETSNRVVGLWLPEARGISVGYNTADVTVCHEVGHALDTYTGFSNMDEWNALYAAEAAGLQTSGNANYMTSAKEYFAEAFNQYCINKENLKATCPGTYAYIENAVATVA